MTDQVLAKYSQRQRRGSLADARRDAIRCLGEARQEMRGTNPHPATITRTRVLAFPRDAIFSSSSLTRCRSDRSLWLSDRSRGLRRESSILAACLPQRDRIERGVEIRAELEIIASVL